MRTLLLALLVLLAAPAALAQLPETNADYFAPLDLPTPNAYRTASGRPGPAYWQQQADYAIDVALDPATGLVTGTGTITYTNNSPEALGFLWLQLDQNRFAEGSLGSAITRAGTRFSGTFRDGGFTIESVSVTHDGRTYTPRTLIDDTRMRVDLEEDLAPSGGQLALTIAWRFTVPEYGADRMGRLAVEGGTVYTIAQWFPRMAVFDDVNGWNTLPYLGQGEFYLNFGDYEVAITVPADHVVVATGALQNPEEVYTPEQLRRLDAARQSAETVMIIAPEEVGTSASRPAASGTLTWRFRAEDVRDFAWAASERFILDAAGYTTPAGNEVLVMSAYPPEGVSADPAQPGWEEATRFGRHSIQFNSEMWYPYPYPVAISVAGVVGGMEYPMIHFSSVRARGEPLFGVIDHELGHNWFPMIVASNERRHAWLDEGLNSFLNAISGPPFYNENPDPTIAGYGRGDEVRMYALTRSGYVAERMQDPIHQDQPIVTAPDVMRGAGLGFLVYRKPAKGLFLLRDLILGPERFDAAFREYIERWAFKHPEPADFFRTMEDVSGEDLDWFWRAWFYGNDTADQAVAAVRQREGGTTVTVEQRGGLILPVELDVTFEDGTTERVRVPVQAFTNASTFEVGIPGDRRVTAVRLDPDGLIPDTDRSNDAWSAVAGQ